MKLKKKLGENTCSHRIIKITADWINYCSLICNRKVKMLTLDIDML